MDAPPKDALTGTAYVIGIMLTALLAIWKFLPKPKSWKTAPVVEVDIRTMFEQIQSDFRELSKRLDDDRREFRQNFASFDSRIQWLEGRWLDRHGSL